VEKAPGSDWIECWLGISGSLDVVVKREAPISVGNWTLVVLLIASHFADS